MPRELEKWMKSRNHNCRTYKVPFDFWCERGDSNPHGLLRQILSLVRLPIPPLSH